MPPPQVKLFSRVLDFGLNTFDTETDQLLICSSEPTDYSAATAAMLGYKSVVAGSLFGSPADYTYGRKVASLAITDGTITTAGTPYCWAAVDAANSRLHALGQLAYSGSVSSGQSWRFDSFTIDMPGWAPPAFWWLTNSTIDMSFQTDRYYEEQSDVAHLYLKGEGADASTSIIDSTGRHVVTAVGNAQIDTAQFKFGASSILLDGTGDYLSIGSMNSSDFAFSTGAFTIDCFVRLNAINKDQVIFDGRPVGSNAQYPAFYVTSGNVIVYFSVSGTINITGTTTLSANTWYHIAVARSGTSTKLFLNGTQEGSTATDATDYIVAASRPVIGVDGNSGSASYLDGWINSLRVVKGTAIWTTTFTPPTAPYRVPLTGPYNHLSISRASTGYAQTVAGTLTSFATNTLRITDKGLLVEDARTNVEAKSQEFNDAVWIKEACTVTADQIAAPDGTTTADKLLVTNNGVNDGRVRQQATATLTADTNYTYSVYLKVGTTNTWVDIQASDFVANFFGTSFNLTGVGSLGTAGAGGDGTFTSQSIEALASGWYRCIFTGKFTAARNPYLTIQVGEATEGANPTINEFYYAWGAQVELGSFASSYIPTTTVSVTRAADAITCIGSLDSTFARSALSMRVDHDPAVVDANTSYIGGGGTYDRLGTQFGDTRIILKSTGADLFVTPAGGVSVRTNNIIAAAGLSTSGRSVVALGGTVATDADATGDFSPSYIGNNPLVGGGRMDGYFRRITAWGQRLADATLQSYTDPATTLSFPIDADAKVDLNFAGNQYYAMPLVTDYLSCSRASTGYATTAEGTLIAFASNTLRVTSAGLLVEDARTNLLQQSQTFGTTWVPTNLTVTADQTVAPDATTTADKLAATSSDSHVASDLGALTAATDYCYSVYAKSSGTANTWISILSGDGGFSNYFAKSYNLTGSGSVGAATPTLGDGSVTSSSIEALANGWYRCVLVGKFTGSRVTSLVIYGPLASDAGATVSGDFFYAWGAQLELGSFASSYIPTTTVSVTRAADVVTFVGNLSAVMGVLPFSFVADMTATPPSTSLGISGILANGTGSSRLMYNQSDTNFRCTGTVLDATLGHSLTFSGGVKVGAAEASGDRNICAGGGTVSSDSTAEVFDTGTLGMSSFTNVFHQCRRFTAWNTKLSDASLQGFTSP